MSVQTVGPDWGSRSAPEMRRRGGELDRGWLEFEGSRLTFQRDDEIFGEGEAADCVYQVVSGAVRTYRLLSDGRRQIEEFYYPGDCFGLEANVERRATCEAMTETVVNVTRRAALTERALNDNEMARRLWKLTAHDLNRTRDHIVTLGRRSAVERVAGFLLELADRTEAPYVVELPMSRQDIADYVELTIETVSRTFTQLQVSGHIAILTSRRISIPNRDRLARICE